MSTATLSNTTARLRNNRAIPAQLLIGLVLVAVAWTVSWLTLGIVSRYTFFTLWLGYFLVVDGIGRMRTGTSLMKRSGWRVAWLFVASIPLWWVFEALNDRVENWHYYTPFEYSLLEYVLIGSWFFSTVIPAVFATTEVVRSFGWHPLRRLPPLRMDGRRLLLYHLAGWAMLLLLLQWPGYFFAFIWLSLFFMLDPLVTALGGRSIGWHIARGDWSPVFNLAIGTLICAWFWEMWNFYAIPKWFYTVPYVDFLDVWEMPLLGYSGYIPFGLEVYAFYMLARRLLPEKVTPVPRVSGVDAIERVDERNL